MAWTTARLFEGLQQSVKTALMAEARRMEVSANVQLCSEGEAAAQLFLILKGQAKYCRLTRDGKQVILYWLGPGDTFGLGTLAADPVPYVGSAFSVSDCQIVAWTHANIRRLALAHPQLACNAVSIVLHYLSAGAERHSGILGSSAKDRVAKALIGLAKRHVSPEGIDLHITNEELASLADVSPFTVSRVLNNWSRHGALTKQRKILHIHAPEALVNHDR